MRVASSTRHRSCTVTVEQNRYGAMTLRSASDRTYQVVGSESPAVDDALAELTVGSEVTVRLARAHGRGNGWHVTAVEAPDAPGSVVGEPAADRVNRPTRRDSR